MAMNRKQKRLAAKLCEWNPSNEYAFKILDDEAFALSEIAANSLRLSKELLKEKTDIEAHITHLNDRITKINVLLNALEG